MAKLGFGKYGELDIRDVPEDYLRWILESSKSRQATVEAELTRREMVEDADASWMEKVIKAGFRELAKRHHPDAGGNTEDMKELNNAFDDLNQYVRRNK